VTRYPIRRSVNCQVPVSPGAALQELFRNPSRRVQLAGIH
jgi:hypothetical protein